MSSQPSPRLNLETKQGKDILKMNLLVSKEVSSLLRTSLGPKGLDKMIIDGSSVEITNDGATIMRDIRPSNPMAHLLRELATSQESSAGDGTTTAVLLAGHLSAAILRLLEVGLHPATIRQALLPLLRLALETVRESPQVTSAISLDSLLQVSSETKGETKGEERKVEGVIRNVISSKSISSYPAFAPLLREYFTHSLPALLSGQDAVSLFTQVGPTAQSSCFIPGAILAGAKFPDCGMPLFSPSSQTDNNSGRKCLFLQTPLLSNLISPQPWMEAAVTVRSYEQIDALVQQKADNFRTLVRLISALHSRLGVDAFFYMKTVTQNNDSASVYDEKFTSFLRRKGIYLVEMDRANFEMAAGALGARPVVKLAAGEDLEVERLRPSVVSVEKILKVDATHLLLFSRRNSKNSEGTLFLTASNKILLAEVKRSVEDAIGVLQLLVRSRDGGNARMVLGAGVFEMRMARGLEEIGRFFLSLEEGAEEGCLGEVAARFCGNREALGAARKLLAKRPQEVGKIAVSLGGAFEKIIIDLACNAGMDGAGALGDLKKLHAGGNHRMGLDIGKKIVTDDIGVEMPFGIQESAVKLAGEFCYQVCKINDMIS